jgi:hypothetical protein
MVTEMSLMERGIITGLTLKVQALALPNAYVTHKIMNCPISELNQCLTLLATPLNLSLSIPNDGKFTLS